MSIADPPGGASRRAADVDADFDAAIDAHDHLVRGLGLDIWVGSEPTFTDCSAFTPEWTCAALGADKHHRARQLIARLASAAPGAALLRSVGRQYRGEALPRWSYGLLANRDGTPLWHGPPDPLLATDLLPRPDVARFAGALAAEGRARHFDVVSLAGAAAAEPSPAAALPAGVSPAAASVSERRLVMREADTPLPPHGFANACFRRFSIHDTPTAETGLSDPLAEQGFYLFVLGVVVVEGNEVVRLELPVLGDIARLRRVLDMVGDAATRAGLTALILAGFPPAVDATLAWTTVTPDPAVVEVNMAPYPRVAELLAHSRTLFAASAALDLAPYRLWYNGDVDDSGGGGHITLGGPSPHDSPFAIHRALLPRLVRYANHHPCLSYLFAHDHIGAGGQSVRADERDREHFDELGLALHLLDRHPDARADLIWRSLAPFLADITGNSHRAELNLEKFCNPGLPERGCLGLVEFRALRMAPSAQRLAALAALLRSVVARLALHPFDDELIDWARELHDRFALPFFLLRDAHHVFADLENAGCALGAPIRQELLDDEHRQLGSVRADGVTLGIKRALEFWPLVGDLLSQTPGPSRLVDASTARLEVCLRPDADTDPADFAAWQVAVAGLRLPLAIERDERGPAKVIGLRYRRFASGGGLHPLLPAQGPLALLLWHPDRDEALRVSPHEWRPDGAVYDGLPADRAAARARRQARVTVERAPKPGVLPDPPARALTPWCLDLRRLGD